MCNPDNPYALVRSGTTQDDRYKNRLDPTQIKIDDRTVSDFILFAKRYSKYIKYYNEINTVDGNWEEFWNNDISAILASICGFEMRDYLSFYSSLKSHLISLIENPGNTAAKTAALQMEMKLLFHLNLYLVRELSVAHKLMSNYGELRDMLARIIARELQEPFSKLCAYYKGANTNATVVFNVSPLSLSTFEANTLTIEIPDIVKGVFDYAADFVNANLELPYNTGTWSSFWSGVQANTLPFSEGTTLSDCIYDSLNYNLFINCIDGIFHGMLSAINVFKKELNATLSNFPSHNPHFALWLVFIRLYRYGQDEINQLTDRHLYYYYTEVLKQIPRTPKANKSHLIFELSKDVPKYLLEKGRLFKAGKDATEKPVSYELMEDFLINRGKVSQKRSFYLSDTEFPVAAFKTDTKDGIDVKLDDAYPYWSAFHKGYGTGDAISPKARLGFAIADKNLFLRDGLRKISIGFDAVMPSNLDGNTDFEVYYTSVKGWQKVTFSVDEENIEYNDPLLGKDTYSPYPGAQNVQDFGGKIFNQGETKMYMPGSNNVPEYVDADSGPTFSSSIDITLEPSLPPVVQFNPKVHINEEHTDTFNTTLPIIKVVIYRNYNEWKAFTYSTISLDIEVKGIKNYVLQNKDGIADTSKPFSAFGAIPDKQPSFTIGSTEIFSKRLGSISLNMKWLEPYWASQSFHNRDYSVFKTKVQYLQDSEWRGQSSFHSTQVLFTGDGSDEGLIKISGPFVGQTRFPEQKLKNELLTAASKAGFIKVTAENNFGHHEHSMYLTDYMVAAVDIYQLNGDYPETPYASKLAELSIDYTTKTKTPDLFFELHPFGYAHQSAPHQITPVYNNKGEFYIGVEGLNLPEKLTMLFQVRTGTSDPLANPAEMTWAYLRGNSWISTDLQVDDKTTEFAGSGIIGFIIPKDATNSSTIMPPGYHWLRMSVAENINALNDLISVDAQAATVQFVDQDNDPAFLNNQIEAGTISKLVQSASEIKKITQKYASFDGSGAEATQDYYVRVSERLRHKNRAVTLWDYEHLVLQQFPKVYKVKCLNHTEVLNGNKPGHVTIVPVPRIESIFKDPLRPYTDKKTRLDIMQFLKERTSPFVCLHVEQPKLEAVQVDFKVKFRDDIVDMVFYTQRLNNALIQFLTPWAFGQSKDISFGGKWYKADLINFIDELPYVDYIEDFKLYHLLDPEAPSTAPRLDSEVALASTQMSILVSARQHLITNINNDINQPIEEDDCICEHCDED